MKCSDPAGIESLRNLGAVSAGWLREAGVTTVGELAALGSVVAYRLVKSHRPTASLNLLWALEAGLADIDWRDLTEARKAELRTELADE